MRLFNRDVRLLLVVAAVNGFVFFGINTLLYNLFLLRLGYGPAFIGLVNAVGPLATVLLGLSTGVWSRRWGSRRVMVAGLATAMASLGLVPLAEFVPDGWQAAWLVALSFLLWVGITFLVVNINPFLMMATTPAERDHAFSLYFALLPVAGFAGSLVGGLLPDAFALLVGVAPDDPAPYRYSLWIGAALCLPGVLAMWSTGEVGAQHGHVEAATAGPAPYVLILVMAVVMFLRTAGEWSLRIFFNVYLDAGLQVSTPLIGALFAGGQLLGLTALAAPLIAGRWSKRRMIIAGMAGMACSLLPVVLVAHWAAVGLGFMGVVALSTLTNPAISILSQDVTPPAWRTTMAGAMFMAFGLSSSGMALGGGYLVTVLGYRPLFLVAAGLTAAGALLFWAYFRAPRVDLVHRPAIEL